MATLCDVAREQGMMAVVKVHGRQLSLHCAYVKYVN